MQKIILCLSIIISPLTFAANTPETLQQATELLEDNQPTAAYRLLRRYYDPKQTDNQELFLLGMAAKQSENHAEAQQFFEQLLTRDPNAARVKLELAETVFQQGQPQYARDLLMNVKQMNPPRAVLKNIDQFIYQIDNPGKTANTNTSGQWNVWAEAGFTYDSNANAAPVIDTVTMYNIPFTLSDDAKETGDTIKTLKLGMNHAVGLSPSFSWQSSLSASWQDYHHLSELDTLQFNAQTGPAFALSPNMRLNLPLTLNRTKIGHQSSYYYYSYGLSPRLSYHYSPALNLNLSATVAKRKYRDKSKSDIFTVSVSPSIQYQFNPKSIFGVGVTVGREKSNIKSDSNNSLGLFSNYRYHFSDTLFSSLSLGYETHRHDEKDFAFNEKRKDNLLTGTISLTKHLDAIDADLNFFISHSKNNSNTPLYDYKRTQTYLGISKTF